MTNFTKQEIELNKKINENLEEAKRFRKQFENGWKEEERYYKGDQWVNQSDTPRPTKNLIFALIESEVPVLVDSSPTSDIIAVDQQFKDAAVQLDAAIDFEYETENWDLKYIKIVRSMLKSCCGWTYVGYDHEKNNGEGGNRIKVLPWPQVLVDPSADDIESANYAFIRLPVNVDEIKRQYPKQAKLIKPVSFKGIDPLSTSMEGRDEDRMSFPFGDGEEVNKYAGSNTGLIEEVYIKDYSLIDIDPQDTQEEIQKETQELVNGINPDITVYKDHASHIEAHSQIAVQIASQAMGVFPDEITPDIVEGLTEDANIGLQMSIIRDHIRIHRIMLEENPKAKRPKYKHNLRKVIRTNDNIILSDGEPEEDHGMIPLTPFYAYVDETSLYGWGEIKNILSMQKTYNDMDWAEYANLRVVSNSGWVVDQNSGVDADTLTNKEGIVVEKVQGTEARRLEPGQVSPQLGHRKKDEVEMAQFVSGVNEVTQGQSPDNVTAFRAVRAIKEQAIGRIRLKTKYAEKYSMPRQAKMVASNIQQFWSTDRLLKVYDNNGKMSHIRYDPDLVKQLKYEIKIVPGTTSGMDKESVFTLFSNLAQQGVIPAKTFMRVIDIPHKDSVMEDLEQNDEKDAMLQQQQAQIEELTAILEQAQGNAPS